MNTGVRVFNLLVIGCFIVSTIGFVQGQDPTKVDAKHYKVVFENDQVRVLQIAYGPGEKSVMHEHPAGVAVMLTDSNTRMTLPDGSAENVPSKAGDVTWAEAGKHLPENLSDQATEVILVELKNK